MGHVSVLVCQRVPAFHALRHFFATPLITDHADPREVQRALRHSTAQITLET